MDELLVNLIIAIFIVLGIPRLKEVVPRIRTVC